MFKNVAGQKWRVFAFNRSTNAPVLGDAANITAKLSLDYGARTATSSTNPTEAEDGYYYFDLSQAETNANLVEIFPESATSGVQVIGVPARELPVAATGGGGGSGGGSGSGVELGAGFPSDDYLIRYLSENGIISFGDHDQNGAADLGVLEDCKNFAASQTAGRLAKRYTYAMLLTAPMMSEVFAVATLRRYCMRRGNGVPASLETSYQEFFAKDGLIDQIASGEVTLTDTSGNPLRPKNSNSPSWSNLQVDRWYPESKVRVVTGNSDMTTSRLPRKPDRFPESFG